MSGTNDIQLLVDALRSAIDSRLLELHTAIPAEVLSFDASNATVNVQPSIKRKMSDGTVVSLPVIQNVPICYPQGGGAIICFPLERGDPVLLVFSERSLDVWWTRGGTVDPLDARKHNLSDAIAIPGVTPRPRVSPRISPDHLRIEAQDASIELQKAGKFKIGKINGDELFDLLSQTLQEMSIASNGAGPLANAAAFAALKVKIDALKG
jgi:hypothetical protein